MMTLNSFAKYIQAVILGVVLLASVLGAGGCGGGGSTTTPAVSTSRVGSLKLSVLFPAPLTRPSSANRFSRAQASGGAIPLGTNAVKIEVTTPDGVTDLAQPQIIPRPTDPSLPADATFGPLPDGDVLVTATAYADLAATEPLGAGSTTATIREGAMTTAHVFLTLGPVDHVTVNPTTLDLFPPGFGFQSSGSLQAVVQDVNNNSLPGFPIAWVSSNPNVATVTYDPINSNMATVTAVAPGMATITATEVNSGKSGPNASAAITVEVGTS